MIGPAIRRQCRSSLFDQLSQIRCGEHRRDVRSHECTEQFSLGGIQFQQPIITSIQKAGLHAGRQA
ncbi:hypothetical protein RHOFW510R12_00770 [Rhodanobacter sp. FW510-R12]